MCDGIQCDNDSNCQSGTCEEDKTCMYVKKEDDKSLLWLWIILGIIGGCLLLWLIYLLFTKTLRRNN